MTEEINDTLLDENTEVTLPIAEPISTENISVSIGELIRLRREEKNLSLKTISQQTKIHIGLLEHLENNDLAKLPSKTYVRGFVKSAAKILGINEDYAINTLEATYNRDSKNVKKVVTNYEMRNETARNTLSSMAATPLEAVKSVTASSAAFLAKATVTLLIVGIIAFNIKNLVDRSAEEHLKLPQVLSTIHQRIKPQKSVAKVIVKPEATVEAAAPMKVNIIQDKKDTIVKSEITINDVSLKAVSIAEKQFTLDNSITGDELNEIFPTRYRVHVTKGIESVYINALDGDSWVTYKVDEKEIKKFVLRQGRTLFLRGEKIRLFLGNTKSVKLFYNNNLVALNSKSSARNIVFPEELKTKFMNPLFVFQKDGTVVTSEDYIKANQKETAVPASSPLAPAKSTVPKKI